MSAKLEVLLEVEVRQETGQRFQTDEAIDIGGHDRPIQAVGALYIGAGGHRGAGSCAGALKPAPDKALGPNRIKLHGKDDHPKLRLLMKVGQEG